MVLSGVFRVLVLRTARKRRREEYGASAEERAGSMPDDLKGAWVEGTDIGLVSVLR